MSTITYIYNFIKISSLIPLLSNSATCSASKLKLKMLNFLEVERTRSVTIFEVVVKLVRASFVRRNEYVLRVLGVHQPTLWLMLRLHLSGILLFRIEKDEIT